MGRRQRKRQEQERAARKRESIRKLILGYSAGVPFPFPDPADTVVWHDVLDGLHHAVVTLAPGSEKDLLTLEVHRSDGKPMASRVLARRQPGVKYRLGQRRVQQFRKHAVECLAERMTTALPRWRTLLEEVAWPQS